MAEIFIVFEKTKDGVSVYGTRMVKYRLKCMLFIGFPKRETLDYKLIEISILIVLEESLEENVHCFQTLVYKRI